MLEMEMFLVESRSVAKLTEVMVGDLPLRGATISFLRVTATYGLTPLSVVGFRCIFLKFSSLSRRVMFEPLRTCSRGSVYAKAVWLWFLEKSCLR